MFGSGRIPFSFLGATLLSIGLLFPPPEAAASVTSVDKSEFKALKKAALRDEGKADLDGYLLGSQAEIVTVRNNAMILCTKADKMAPPDFAVVVEIGVDGRIAKVNYYPDTPAAHCIAQSLDQATLPEPPRALRLLWGTSFPKKKAADPPSH